jgi:glycosyltransferase involved in cell wall biosynthesis
MEIRKTLIIVPNLNGSGGVVNYYKTLELNKKQNINYFPLSKVKPKSFAKIAFRLILTYLKFTFYLIRFHYKTIVVNPTLDPKSFHRDSVFIIITHLLGKRTIVFFRGWVEPFEEKIKSSRFKSLLFRISYAKAGKFIVLGNVFKEKLIAMGVPANAEFNIETTVADSSFLDQLDLNKKFMTFEEEIKFLILSRIVREKGIYIAIDAFCGFMNKCTDRKCSLVIAGDGPELTFAKTYVTAKKIPNIIFPGHVEGKAKMKLLLDSHILIFPSYSEGLPNSILEGMLYGMPILTRRTGGIPEVISNNINGFITESYESFLFTDFILKLVSDKLLYQKIANTNHQEALLRFTSEKVKERILSLIRK